MKKTVHKASFNVHSEKHEHLFEFSRTGYRLDCHTMYVCTAARD